MPKKKFTFSRDDEVNALIYGHRFVRSKKSRDVDNATSRGVTTDFGKVWRDPSRNDFPGIDTIVKQDFPNFTEKKGKKAFNLMTEIFGESGFK